MSSDDLLALLAGAGGDIALVDADHRTALTYAELRDRVVAAAAALPGRAGPGLVLIYADNDIDTVVRLLSAWAAGHAVLLADPSLPADAREGLELAYSPDVVLGPGGMQRYADALLPPLHDGLALVLSTSGSTGSAKGVRLARTAVLANARSIAAALRIDADHRAAATLPLHYTYGLSVLLSHLVAGATVVFTRASPVQRGYVEALEGAGVTTLAGVPYTYAVLDRAGFFDRLPTSLRRMTQAGGRMEPDVVRRISERLAHGHCELWVMYGQTEACARMTVLPPEHLETRLGAVGWAVPGGELRVEREGGAAEPGAIGDVVFTGPNVMWGYCRTRADLALGDELNGVLRTGDLGHLDGDGCLWLSGRASRFAKLAGVRVSLDDLERMLPDLGEVAATTEADRVRLHVTCEDALVHRRALRALARRLRLHHSLFSVTVHTELPRTPRGKVDYVALQGWSGQPG